MSFLNQLFSSNKEKQTTNKTAINWQILTTEEQLDQIIERSATIPVALFKHSTRCSISTAAKSRLERQWTLDSQEVEIYYLDLIQYRNVSNKIADLFGVQHQSPQLILIRDGKAIYDTSHNGISVTGLKSALNSSQK